MNIDIFNDLNDVEKEFLLFGYKLEQDINCLNQLDLILRKAKRKPRTNDIEYLKSLLKNTIEPEVSRTEGRVVIPLSGGVDSRILLATALEVTPVEKILIVSYGCRGSYDVEIAKSLARQFNVNIITTDLSVFDWSTVICNKTHLGRGWFVQDFLNSLHGVVVQNDLVLSGYLGDPISGSHFDIRMYQESEDECVKSFIRANRFAYLKMNNGLSNISKKFDFLDSKKLSKHEQLDLTIRQEQFIKPIFKPDCRIVFPFDNSNWKEYWLNLVDSERYLQKWYFHFAYAAFPDAFVLPIKSKCNLNINASRISVKLKQSFIKIGSLLGINSFKAKQRNYFDFEDPSFKRPVLTEIRNHGYNELCSISGFDASVFLSMLCRR